MKEMTNKALQKKIKKLEGEIKEIWTIIKERDNYLFGILSKKVGKLEKKK